MCGGIIPEVCWFNTERPLSGLGVENKKSATTVATTHHTTTPHWPTAKHSGAGKHKARRGKKNDYNSQRGKSVSGLFCSGGARRLHFLFPHFWLGGLSWLTQTNWRQKIFFFNQRYVDYWWAPWEQKILLVLCGLFFSDWNSKKRQSRESKRV